jgi:hypothetical protein
MSLTHDQHLHFHCTFRLHPSQVGTAEWGYIPKAIRYWIGKRLEAGGITVDDSFGRRWLFTGGDWRAKQTPRVMVATEAATGAGTLGSPEHWSLRYEIPDSAVSHRQWRTDVGVTAVGGRQFQFSLSTVHWLLPGYIGKEPDTPVPSAPGIIRMLLTARMWGAYAGDQHLGYAVIPVLEGRANEFVNSLTSHRRTCPILLVTREHQTNKPLVDSGRLGKLLAGAASVYESESTIIDRELEYLLDREYRCWNGSVRVYQPNVRQGDGRRHRYFTKEDIEQLGAQNVEEMLVRGIARRSQLALGSNVATLEDVVTKQREERLSRLRHTTGNKDELIQLSNPWMQSFVAKGI